MRQATSTVFVVGQKGIAQGDKTGVRVLGVEGLVLSVKGRGERPKEKDSRQWAEGRKQQTTDYGQPEKRRQKARRGARAGASHPGEV